MLPALVLLALQADPVVVAISSKRANADAAAQRVAAKVHQALISAGVPQPVDDPTAQKQLKKAGGDARSCQGATDCLQKLAKLLGPRAVIVGIDVGKIGRHIAVHLEAVAADDAAALAVAEYSDSSSEIDTGAIGTFAKQLATELQHRKPPAVAEQKPADAPTERKLEPAPERKAEAEPAVEAAVEEEQPTKGPRILPWVAAGGALASFGVSTAFLVLGLKEKAAVDSVRMGDTVNLTQAEFEARAQRGNTDFTLALSTLLVGVALGALSGILFSTASGE